MATLKRFVIPGVLVLLLVAAAFAMFRGDDTKTLTAHFPRTISIYEGSDVRVLGVPVGTVDKVTPVRHRRGRDDALRRRREGPRRRQGRDRRAVGRGRPVHPAHARLRRRRGAWPTARRSTRTAPRCRSSSTRSTAASTTSRSRSARPGPTRRVRSPTCSRPRRPTSAARARSSTRPSRTSASSAPTLDDNKEELFGSARKLEGFISTLADERHDRAPLQRLARRRVDDALRRAPGAVRRRCATSRPRSARCRPS